MKKRTLFLSATLTAILMAVGLPAIAAFQGIADTTDLKIFNKIRCGAGLTCTRVGSSFNMVSSPTISSGPLVIEGDEATDAILTLQSDQADDNGDKWKIKALASGNALTIYNNTSGSDVAKFSISTAGATDSVGNFSVATNKFTVAAATGNTAVAGTEDVVGDFSVATNKFNVTAASGNIAAAGTANIVGDFSVATNKFNVTAASGNTAIAGTANVVGNFSIATSKFTVDASTGAVVVTGTVTGDGGDALTGFLQAQVAATATTITAAQCGSTFYNTGAVVINLPNGAAGLLGCRLTFITLNASNFDINPGNSDQIMLLTNAAGDAIRNATVANTVVLQYAATNVWVDLAHNGTWSDIN